MTPATARALKTKSPWGLLGASVEELEAYAHMRGRFLPTHKDLRKNGGMELNPPLRDMLREGQTTVFAHSLGETITKEKQCPKLT